jgi:hypothetical protein
VDSDRPSVARVYDYFLGGSHNFAADRALAEQVIAVLPEMPMIARANRSFLHRAVRFLIEAGVDQFLDLGSGIPTVGNVHDVAQRASPRARVAYVDVDPVAVAHARILLADNDRATAVRADLRRPDQVLDHADTRALLDFDRPVAVLMVAVLHFVADPDDPAGLVARYLDAVPSGSYLVLSHASTDGRPPAGFARARDMAGRTASEMTTRSYRQIADLLTGLDPVDPGLVRLPLWRPDPTDAHQAGEARSAAENFPGYGAVGRKP